jgi:hypothetical protein
MGESWFAISLALCLDQWLGNRGLGNGWRIPPKMAWEFFPEGDRNRPADRAVVDNIFDMDKSAQDYINCWQYHLGDFLDVIERLSSRDGDDDGGSRRMDDDDKSALETRAASLLDSLEDLLRLLNVDPVLDPGASHCRVPPELVFTHDFFEITEDLSRSSLDALDKLLMALDDCFFQSMSLWRRCARELRHICKFPGPNEILPIHHPCLLVTTKEGIQPPKGSGYVYLLCLFSPLHLQSSR